MHCVGLGSAQPAVLCRAHQERGPVYIPALGPAPGTREQVGLRDWDSRRFPARERGVKKTRKKAFANLCLGQTAEAHIRPVDLKGHRSLARRGFGRRCPCTHAGMAGRKRQAV